MLLLNNKLRRKQVMRFVVLTLLYYVLFMLPWPGLVPGYGALFRAGGNFLFSSFGHGGAVEFLPADEADVNNDTSVRVQKIGVRAIRAGANSRYMSYLSAAVVAALVLATPLQRRRKLWALAGSLLLIHGFAVLRVFLWLINLDRKQSLGLFELGTWSRTVVAYAGQILVVVPETKFVAPVAVWVLVCFRREDFAISHNTTQVNYSPPKHGPNKARRKPRRS